MQVVINSSAWLCHWISLHPGGSPGKSVVQQSTHWWEVRPHSGAGA